MESLEQKKQTIPVQPDKPRLLLIQPLEKETSRLQYILHQAGYDVNHAPNAEIALKLLEVAVRPGLILIDSDLGETSLSYFSQQMQQDQELARIPILLLLPAVSELNQLKAFAVGAVDYLIKPIDPASLQAALGTHLQTGTELESAFSELKPPENLEFNLFHRIDDQDPGGKEPDLRAIPPTFDHFKHFLVGHLRPPLASLPTILDAGEADIYDLTEQLTISPEEMARYIASFLELKFMPRVDPESIRLGVLTKPFCERNHVLPIQTESGKLAFVMSNPFNLELLDTLRKLTSHFHLFITAPDNIPLSLLQLGQPKRLSKAETKPEEKPKADVTDLVAEIQSLYTQDAKAIETVEITEEVTEREAPIISLVNRLIEGAYTQGASDIHIEPWEEEVLVRFRIDGDLRILYRLRPQKLINPIIARIKIMSNLDISERRLPQDGRIVFKTFNPGCDIDLRVATGRMNFGEKVVMRILDKRRVALSLDQLGFSGRHLSLYREKLRAPYGMILHVGPTGSGKSLTLYSALKDINRPEINIQTIEDPIEYTLPGINQQQVRHDIGLSFARVLRSYLRQDPDVLLVGEIRDQETALISVEAALTGHLLLSTLHTNDAATTLTRLVEMGIEPYLISSSILLICAQRLLRRLCSHCREAYEPSDEEKSIAGLSAEDTSLLYRPRGCPACNQIGYKGRIGIHELLIPDDTLREALAQPKITADELKRLAISQCGMQTLYQDAMDKVRQGITSLEEALAKVQLETLAEEPLPAEQEPEAPLIDTDSGHCLVKLELVPLQVITRKKGKRKPKGAEPGPDGAQPN